MDRKRILRSSNASPTDKMDKKALDFDSDDVATTSNLMSYSCYKRRKISEYGTVNGKKSVMHDQQNVETLIPSAWWTSSASNGEKTNIAKLDSDTISKHALSLHKDEGNVQSSEDGKLLNVGKTVFSWALEKLGYPTNPSKEEARSEDRLGFTFVNDGEKDVLSSSILTEDNQSMNGGFLSSIVEDDQEDEGLSDNATGISEGAASDGFFTPIGSPDVNISRLTPRRSILSSQQSPGAPKIKPRVSINRTPQVREIASRADQAKNSSLIWEHRDLDVTECEEYRVPGDTTPEINGTAYLSSLPTSPSVIESPRPDISSTDEHKSDPSSSVNSTHLLTTPDRIQSSDMTALDARSPNTREGALALLDFRKQDMRISSICRPSLASFGPQNYKDVMTVAVEQQAVVDSSLSIQPRFATKSAIVPQHAPDLPTLNSNSGVMNKAIVEQTMEEHLISVRQSDAVTPPEVFQPMKRVIVLPRLMPRKILTTRVRPKLCVERSAVVPRELCRPVEEMVRRNVTTQWLPPVYSDSDCEDDWEDEETEDNLEQQSTENSEIVSDSSSQIIEERTESPELHFSAAKSYGLSYGGTDKPFRSTRDMVKEHVSSLADDIYTRLQEKMRNAAEERKQKWIQKNVVAHPSIESME